MPTALHKTINLKPMGRNMLLISTRSLALYKTVFFYTTTWETAIQACIVSLLHSGKCSDILQASFRIKCSSEVLVEKQQLSFLTHLGQGWHYEQGRQPIPDDFLRLARHCSQRMKSTAPSPLGSGSFHSSQEKPYTTSYAKNCLTDPTLRCPRM